MSGSIEGRHHEASDDGAGCGARGRETNAPPTHSGGAGAPPGGQYEPPARSWLTVQPLRLARSFLPERPSDNGGNPGGGSRQPRIGKSGQDGGPESAARRRHSVYDCGRSGRRRPQMSPGIERCSGGAPGGASAFPQGDADLEPTTAAPPGAPSPRIRRGRETKGRRACPGPRQRIRAMAFAFLNGLFDK